MDEDKQLDTQVSEAPEGTPSHDAAQDLPTETPEAEEAPRKYAGKYSSVEELEKAYTSASSKIGQKGYAEKIGEKVVDATGYTVKDLEEAGYSADQIAEAVLAHQASGKQQEMPKVNPSEVIKKTVESSKVDKLQFELEVDRYLRKNPEAEEFVDWVRKMRRHPDYHGKGAAEIFAEVQPLMSKAKKAVEKTHASKERASMSVSNKRPVETPAHQAAADRYKKTGRLDDAASFIHEKLFGGK